MKMWDNSIGNNYIGGLQGSNLHSSSGDGQFLSHSF